jgi:hypothetical protein
MEEADQTVPIFIAGDKDLLSAAQEEGMITENPLDHMEFE